jgi:hypothetical protein
VSSSSCLIFSYQDEELAKKILLPLRNLFPARSSVAPILSPTLLCAATCKR